MRGKGSGRLEAAVGQEAAVEQEAMVQQKAEVLTRERQHKKAVRVNKLVRWIVILDSPTYVGEIPV
jgi:hypothetical protein